MSNGDRHDVIVIGGSAGGVEALMALVAGLSPTLDAAVCVVLHRPAYVESHLTNVLARAARLPVRDATAGGPLERGVIHVAVPDRHLVLERDGTEMPNAIGTLRVVKGPKENRSRPAIDPLFRSAALAFGPRVIGVILSGALDDGAAGLWTICDRGGITVVQDPDDAMVSSMPANAIAEVSPDHIAPASEIGALLGRLSRTPVPATPDAPAQPTVELVREVAMASIDEHTHDHPDRYGVPSRFACPDCGGVLWDTTNGGPLSFRCETGHAYTAAALAESQTEGVERAPWAALRALEDKAALARERADAATGRGLTTLAERYRVQCQAAQTEATAVRTLLRLNGRSGMQNAG